MKKILAMILTVGMTLTVSAAAMAAGWVGFTGGSTNANGVYAGTTHAFELGGRTGNTGISIEIADTPDYQSTNVSIKSDAAAIKVTRFAEVTSTLTVYGAAGVAIVNTSSTIRTPEIMIHTKTRTYEAVFAVGFDVTKNIAVTAQYESTISGLGIASTGLKF